MKRIRTALWDKLALLFFVGSVACLVFSYGVLVGKYHVFPYRILALAADGFRELSTKSGRRLPEYYTRVDTRSDARPRPPLTNTQAAYKGLNLVTQVTSGHKLSVQLMDMEGQSVHEWNLDWFRVWPGAHHVPGELVPRTRPGTHIHGAVLMENGDLVFNFDHLGLVRVDPDGDPVWRLPYRTHHSIHRHDDGNLWVCGQKEQVTPDPRFPDRSPPFDTYTILEVAPRGSILREWSISDLLHKNGWPGLLYLNTSQPHDQVRDDRLHLNDVEPFPAGLDEGHFKEGDVMVSLRNTNTVFVFNRETEKITFICVGRFIWQHDPDFIDGNRFSVFDNHRICEQDQGQSSRILIVSAADRSSRVVFEGTRKTPFYTPVLGKHQWLPNGNLLITESLKGRAFEIDREGKVVWEYINYVGPETVGWVQEVQRVPLRYKQLYEKDLPGQTRQHRPNRPQSESATTSVSGG